MASAGASTKPKKVADELVTLELNPAGGVDVLGEETPPLLVLGWERDFTRAEADALLALRNPHGVPVCRVVEGNHGDTDR